MTQLIWAVLLHMSHNMWNERHPRLQDVFDERLWRQLLDHMAAAGMNMVVIDLGDAVKYRSHPEIAVRGAWTPARMKKELARIRALGLEPIPKLNFSACHDRWLGGYYRCISSKTYYNVCRDLIAEVIDLFDRPRLFHLGMDEDVVREFFGIWPHDLKFLAAQVRKGGSRPWIWSDHMWKHNEEFFGAVPRNILQSNWYYDTSFSRRRPDVRGYLELEARGYDQIPTGSNYSYDENFDRTVDYCRKHVAPQRLLGFLQTPWRATTAEFHEHNCRAITLAGQARAKFQRDRSNEAKKQQE